MRIITDGNKLYILVEGPDDERFFERLIPLLREKYSEIKIVKYAQTKEKNIDNLLKSIKGTGAKYVYMVDLNDSPCIRGKKSKIKCKLKNIDEKRIIVVRREIESWYIAGLDKDGRKRLKIKCSSSTDSISKEQFNNLIPRKFADSRINFMIEILNSFSISAAKNNNTSFSYFFKKLSNL